MPHFSLCGLPYIRTVMHTVTAGELASLQKKHHYIYLVSYVKCAAPRGCTRTEKHTAVIPLTDAPDAILARFKKNTRNEIRKSEHIPELTFRVDDTNRRESYAVYAHAKTVDGALLSLKREFSQCLLSNAYWKGKMIVSIASYRADGILRFKTIASLRKDEDMDPRIIGYATRRLVWEICMYGKEKGYTTIDLGGINFSQNAKKGIAQFKQSFGGDVIPEYTYRYESRIFSILRKVLTLFGKEIF